MADKNILTRSKKKKALALLQARRLPEARELYEQICRTDPTDNNAWLMLGGVYGMLNLHQEAADSLQKSISLNPANAESHYNYGIALRSLGQPDAAEAAFRQAIKIKSGYPEALECLAHALLNRGVLDEAAQVLHQALRLRPNYAEWWSNLGAILQTQGFLEKAISYYRKAQQLKPGDNIALNNLGSTLTAQGKAEEALAAYRDGIAKNPANAQLRSNMLMTLNYLPVVDPQIVLDEHRAWGRIHEAATPSSSSFPNVRNPDRRLRIGYVSPDFREHSVANFFEPLLAARDREAFEVICYSDMPRPDATTVRLRLLADGWRDTHKLDHDRMIQLVRTDSVDILVDLAGHTANNRLPVFAKKPAPVQLTYLGYPNTTGLSTMDYRLTDASADPEGQEMFYTEKLVRLSGCFLCYVPPAHAPDVSPLPVDEAEFITFGSFNNLAKINRQVIELWSEILRGVPNARLLVKNHSLTDQSVRENYYGAFAKQGVSRDRLDLIGHTPSREAHLALYRHIDIALDTFPYNGATTTCEALWMGVPVITLSGKHHAGRVGLSLLSALKLEELVTHSPADYAALASMLANDRQKLAGMRTNLRERMRTSPLCDVQGFARKVEKSYREMWRSWCDEKQ